MKKKAITVLAASLMTAVCLGKTTIDVGTNEVDAISYCNGVKNGGYVSFITENTDSDVIKQCDAILNAKNVTTCNYMLENCYNRWCDTFLNNIDTNICAIMKSFGDEFRTTGKCDNIYRKNVAWMAMRIRLGDFVECPEWLINLCQGKVKKVLRKQGKSFVTKNNINPIEIQMKKLTDAFEAPKYEGLTEVLREFGVDYGIDFTIKNPKTDSEIADLKAKILDGDVDLTEHNKAVLRVYLGIEGYNSFVREYNGD